MKPQNLLILMSDEHKARMWALPVDSDFQYECWMLTTGARWRSPVVKAIAGFAKE